MNFWADPEHCAYALTLSFRNHFVTSEHLRPGICGGSTLSSLRKDGMTPFSGPHRNVSRGDLKVERQGNQRVKQMGAAGGEYVKQICITLLM